MDLINLTEDPSNSGKPADTRMGKNIFHMTVTFSEVSAAPVSGFTAAHTTPSWLCSISAVQRCMVVSLGCMAGLKSSLTPTSTSCTGLVPFYSFHEKRENVPK